VASQFPPDGQGGLATHVYGLTRALAGRAALELYLPGDPGRAMADRIGYRPQTGDPLNPDDALAWGLALASGVGGANSPHAQRVRVIHAHNYEAALPALVVKRLTGAPLVVTLHLPAPPEHEALERRLLEAADAVISVSGALAAEYVERGWRMPGPVVIPNGVDTDFFTPGAAMAREPGRLLFAGRLTPQKGVDLAIRALGALAPALPELRLVVAGAGPWEQAYRNLARRLGCADRVRWLGWLDPEALRDQYRRCTAFLMPSRFEPFGLSALEAMACGATVVASTAGGLPEFIRDNVTGRLTSPSDPAALAAAIGALVRDPVGADRLGVAAAETARTLTWARAAEATLRVYERLNYGSLRPLPAAQLVVTLARAEIAAATGADGAGV
jgi:glycosyltransferase involved in cell wall biosynthesis